MRLAVISDIHSNLAAFEAVLADLETQSPDAVVVAGDFLNRGPQPLEVWQLLQTKPWPLLRGNHEDYVVAQCQSLASQDPLANPIWQPARWTAEQIGKDPTGIAHLPIYITMAAPDGSEIVIAHGTTRLNNEGVFGRTSDAELDDLLQGERPALFCCGHTHVALVREYDGTLFVNSGAVGMPFNGDQRAQYAIVTWTNAGWQPELRAVKYDVERTIAAYSSSGFLEGGGPLARVILYELKTSGPHLSNWVRRYADAVHCGEISVAEAVNQYLANPPLPAH